MNDTSATRFPRPHHWWMLAGALLLFLTFWLGSRGLNEPDEGRYANIAAAMAAPGGDWWEPRLSGWGHYDKPPLIYWVTAACFKVFGINAWAARLPSLAGAILTLLGLGWAAYRLRGPLIAWWAVLICGTSLQFWSLGRLLSPDMLLCGWCTLAVAAWTESRAQGGAWRYWFLSLGFWTLAWWTKAAPALIPLAGLAVGVWLAHDAPGRRALRPWLLLPAVLLLGSPWYLLMLHRYPELRSFFFGRELAGRMTGRVNGRHGPPYYYLPVSAMAWLPWWPLAVWSLWRDRQPPQPGNRWPTFRAFSLRLGAEGWIVLTGLVIFSAVSSKLPTYTLPLMPWVALLAARAIMPRVQNVGSPPPLWLAPAYGFALLASIGVVSLLPRYETRLGSNSSLRRICGYLATQGARRIDSDHYWPSMEIYLPTANIHYVVRDDVANLRKDKANPTPKLREERYRERASDPGVPPNRFSEMTPWPELPPDDPRALDSATGEVWLVRFRYQKPSPFDEFLKRKPGENPPVLKYRDGDFQVYCTTLTGGHLPPKE